MAPSRFVQPQVYELIDDGGATPAGHANPEAPPVRRHRGVLSFIAHRPDVVITLVLGIALALTCFAFTLWLSRQIFFCPTWSLYCEVGPAVQFFKSRLGLVQGIVGSIYGLSISMIGYMIYQLAETTLWPAWAQQSFTPREVDRYLAHVRGSLPAFPLALARARRFSQASVVLTVGIFSLLIHVNSAVVGYAYTVRPVNTLVHSNHTIGGGIGFGFSQVNPPGNVPAEIGIAQALYSSWSFAQAVEPLPSLRNFLLDRNNMSLIGNFSVNAIEVIPRINCSGVPISVSDETYGNPNAYAYAVNTSFGTESDTEPIFARIDPHLTSWVDSSYNVSNSRAVARVIFATLNGTLEGGYNNILTDTMAELCAQYGWACSGINSLACDVDIDLVNSQACTSACKDANATLTSTEVLQGVDLDPIFSPGAREIWPISQWLASIVTTMGPYTFGYQPMWGPGSVRTNGTNNTLPVAFSDSLSSIDSIYWSQENITNFISVSVGALAMSIPQGWQLNLTGNVTVVSELPLERLDSHRAMALLAPLAIALGLVLILAVLNVAMHREANVSEIRLAWLSEILLSSQTPDLKYAVDEVWGRHEEKSTLENLKLRFGKQMNGQEGVAKSANVKRFTKDDYGGWAPG